MGCSWCETYDLLINMVLIQCMSVYELCKPRPCFGAVSFFLKLQIKRQTENPQVYLPKSLKADFYLFLPHCQVYRGVRIGGLNMSLKHSQNKGAPHFPHDYPDCPASVRFQEEQETELLHKFRRSATPCS